MNRKVSKINLACENLLIDFAEQKPDWKYVKSKRCFVKSISKDCSMAISTGMTSKVDFVNFQFQINVDHKLVPKVLLCPSKYNCLLRWHRQRWDPAPVNNGRYTVFDHQNPYLREYDQLRSQGKLNYVRLEEFFECLEALFTLAEGEIEKLFDTSSEETLIRSIVDKPIGFFNPNEVLLVQLLLGNLTYYDKLIEYYAQDIELLRSLNLEVFYQPEAEQLMTQHKSSGFIKFSFI